MPSGPSAAPAPAASEPHARPGAGPSELPPLVASGHGPAHPPSPVRASDKAAPAPALHTALLAVSAGPQGRSAQPLVAPFGERAGGGSGGLGLAAGRRPGSNGEAGQAGALARRPRGGSREQQRPAPLAPLGPPPAPLGMAPLAAPPQPPLPPPSKSAAAASLMSAEAAAAAAAAEALAAALGGALSIKGVHRAGLSGENSRASHSTASGAPPGAGVPGRRGRRLAAQPSGALPGPARAAATAAYFAGLEAALAEGGAAGGPGSGGALLPSGLAKRLRAARLLAAGPPPFTRRRAKESRPATPTGECWGAAPGRGLLALRLPQRSAPLAKAAARASALR
jgi:hypothetical protein